MAQIHPPSSPPPSSAAAAPAAATGSVVPVETAVASVPDRIQQLLRQIQVSGTIAAPPDNDTITLNTALGQLVVTLPILTQEETAKLLQTLDALFQNQRPLTVVVQPGTPPTQAFILVPPAPATATSPGILDTITLTQSFTKPAQSLSVGLTLPAVILPSTVSANAPLSMPQQLPPGFGANAPETNINLPAAMLSQVVQEVEQTAAAGMPSLMPLPNINPAAPQQPATPNIPNMPGIPVTPVTPAPAQIPTSAVPSLSLLPLAGREIIVTVNAVTPSSEPLPVSSVPNQIPATIIGNGPNGQLILKTSDAIVYVKQSIAAPIGANVMISVDMAKDASVPLADMQSFPALQQILGALAQADPQFAQQFIQNNIPQPNQQLAGVLLFFLSAMKQGDVKNWLGSTTADMLARIGKFDLAARLVADMNQQAAPLAHDTAVGAWKPYPIPLHADGRLHMLNLYVHHETGEHQSRTDGKRGPAQVRFLIDVRMSKLGPMQLDGLVRPRKLDMIVRSENTLPIHLPNELRQSYIKTLDALGYDGSLVFQVGRKNWLVIQQDAQKSITT